MDITDMELKVWTAECRANLEGVKGMRGTSLRDYEEEIPVLPHVESLYEKLKAECIKRGLGNPTMESVSAELGKPAVEKHDGGYGSFYL